MTLTATEYRDLLRAALPDAVDAETAPVTTRTLFTPQTHRRALQPDVTVVRGHRGVGKSVWFDALLDDEKRRVAADAYDLRALRHATVTPGYGVQQRRQRFPGWGELATLTGRGADSRLIWWSVVVHAIDPALLGGDSWADRVERLSSDLSLVDDALTTADRRAVDTGGPHLVLFDGLDRLHDDRTENDRLVVGILRVALELRTRTRHVRAKIFSRPDVLDRTLFAFPDASKLTSNEEQLTWPDMSLYGLLFHLLGNADTELSRRFRAVGGTGEWDSRADAFVVPVPLVANRDRQQEVFGGFAGKFMGSDRRRGMTYTWLPNHLADGNGQVSPRSFGIALREAAAVSSAEHAGHALALHWEAIKKGVQKASLTRVAEINDDIPWVEVLVQPLRGRQVPIPEEVVHEAWTDKVLASVLRSGPATGRHAGEPPRTGPKTRDHEDLVDELIQLGVMTRRADGRIDLPDVYRVAFGLGRKGGVKRIPA